MAFDDDFDDERARPDAPLPPEDRLWRHPSELSQPIAARPGPRTSTPVPRRRRGRTAAALAGATLGGALVATAVMWVARPTRVVTTQTAAPATTVAVGSFSAAPLPTEDLAEDLAPSLAAVSAQGDSGWSTGTGIWLDDEGTVAVAAPLAAGTSSLLISRPDGSHLSAELVATDATTGMSVLKVERSGGSVMDQAAAPPSAGRPVAIIGAEALAANGEVTQRVVTATVSAAGLRATVDGSVLHDLFQLDRALPAEAVGSVVVDASGTVLGIVLDAAGAEDLAVVAPAAGALEAARALRDDGEVAHGHLGVQAVDLDPAIAEVLEVPGGAHLTDVEPGSPAEGADLRVDDVIVAVDDQAITGASDLVMSLRSEPAGATVDIRWRRGTEESVASIVLD